MNYQPIKNPGTMTPGELAIEVERLRKGLEQSDMAWCPICEQFCNEEMYGTCQDHDVSEFGVSPSIRAFKGMSRLGYAEQKAGNP